MDLSNLPVKSVSFTQAGFDTIATLLTASPDKLATVQGALKDNPRRVIYRLFDLTSVQRAVIANMPDQLLQSYIHPLMNLKVDAGKKLEVKFKPDPICAGTKPLPENLDVEPWIKGKYSCSFEVESAV